MSGRKHGLSTKQFPVSAYVGSSKILKGLKDRPRAAALERCWSSRPKRCRAPRTRRAWWGSSALRLTCRGLGRAQALRFGVPPARVRLFSVPEFWCRVHGPGFSSPFWGGWACAGSRGAVISRHMSALMQVWLKSMCSRTFWNRGPGPFAIRARRLLVWG